MVIDIKKINNILIIILVFFMVFDTARNYTPLPRSFGFIKDIIIYYFFCLLVLKRQIKIQKNIWLYLLLVLVSVWSWIGLFNIYDNLRDTVVYILKSCEFFILLIVFKQYNFLFSIDYKKSINVYVVLSVLLFFVTLFGYYFDNPFIGRTLITDNNQGMPDYRDRISIGQPAIACFPQILAGFYLLTCETMTPQMYMASIICFLGVLLSTSITGIMTLLVILIFFSIYKFIKGSLIHKVVIVLLYSMIGLLFISLVDSDLFMSNFGISYYFVINRIDQFLFDSGVDESMVIRQCQQLYVIKQIQDAPMGYLLGEGCTGVIIENTYYGFLLRYGIVGLVCLILYFSSLILEIVRKYINPFVAIMILVYCLHLYTLDVFYTPTLCYAFPFFLNYFLGDRRDGVN